MKHNTNHIQSAQQAAGNRPSASLWLRDLLRKQAPVMGFKDVVCRMAGVFSTQAQYQIHLDTPI